MIKDMDRASTQDLQIVFSDARDLTSDSIKLIVKKRASDSDGDAVFVVSADVGTSGPNGIAKIEITKDLSDIDPGSYFYDIYYYPNNTGEKQYLLEKGRFNINERFSDKRSS